MANKNIFCSAPWYELQVYWDGGLGFCCQESHRLYPSIENKKYNLTNMSIAEWLNSSPMAQVRKAILGNNPLSICTRCYIDEKYGPTSRRHKCNQKSVIFTKENFKESFEQSPGYEKFIGITPVPMPIDLHIDLGNYCNLACKMCKAQASSTIAVQEVKWGFEESKQYVGTDWTRDQAVWDRTIAEIVAIPNLSNIHFMGGETLITPRFKDFIDALISANRTDIGISFVTNGTTFDKELLNKLVSFKRVGIEVSIESLTEHNEYQRQGTNTQEVLTNLNRYIAYTNNTSITVTLRPAVSALTIGSYWTLLKYALQNKLLVKGQIAYSPAWIHPAVLPLEVRHAYRANYQKLITDHNLTSNVDDYNESDPNRYKEIIYGQIEQTLALLEDPHQPEKFSELVEHCRRWDNVYNYNALELYPELIQEFKKHGY